MAQVVTTTQQFKKSNYNIIGKRRYIRKKIQFVDSVCDGDHRVSLTNRQASARRQYVYSVILGKCIC